MIIFNILTLFPESFSSFIEVGLLGKAFKNKLFLDTHLTLDFSKIDSNISLYENKAVNLFFSKKIKRF